MKRKSMKEKENMIKQMKDEKKCLKIKMSDRKRI